MGAGVGGAYNVVKDITDHNVTIGTGFGYGKGESKFGFAWALIAGLAYNVNQNLTLEMGYRYLDRGKAETGAIACANAGGGGCYFERQSFRATSHDLRFGMRWQFADTPDRRQCRRRSSASTETSRFKTNTSAGLRARAFLLAPSKNRARQAQIPNAVSRTLTS